MIPKSGNRFSDRIMLKRNERRSMSRKSGYRFSEKGMRQRKKFECIPVQLNRDTL
jgi:hypothetical protein